MFKLEIIGNLGADAELHNDNGREYLSFRLAHTDRFTNQQTGEITERTVWVSCFYNGRLEKLHPYLVKGTRLFVRGNGQLRIYSSEKTRQMEAGISCNVSELELCGGMTSEDKQLVKKCQQIEEHLINLGYENYEDIPRKRK